MQSTLPLIEEWTCEELSIDGINCTKLYIEGIKFSDLKELFLQELQICSIEPISRTWMPCLNLLSLSMCQMK